MHPQATPPAPAKAISSHQEITAQELKLKGFKAHEVDTAADPGHPYRRRDFYKVALVTSHCTVHYADRSIELNGTRLMFANPHIPYAIELHEPRLTGYSCLFTEAYLRENDRSESLQQSPLFKVGGTPIFHLTEAQATYARGIYQKILAEQSTGHLYKGGLIRTYLQLLMHEALRMQPTESFVQHQNASSRIAVKGIGEISIVGVTAAVANAVFHATGKRVRSLPMPPGKLLAALREPT